MNFVKLLSDYAYNVYVIAAADSFGMTTLFRNKSVFRKYRMARYIADVTFWQTNRLWGNMEAGRSYWSGKHKLCGYETGVSVLRNGLAIGCSYHHVGCTADVDTFYGNILWHKRLLKKIAEERNVTDVSSEADKFPPKWAFSMDRGYQGAGEYRRAIKSTKTTHGEDLSRRHVTCNKKIAFDRIVMECLFGRQCNLWLVAANKYRLAENN